MLYEFALEPALLSNWDRVRYYLGRFGVDQGRLIARFPRHWDKLVLAALADCKQVERHRIIEALFRLHDHLRPRHDEWDTTLDWLQNAEAEHCQRATIPGDHRRREPAEQSRGSP
jgi:hypothetical protein